MGLLDELAGQIVGKMGAQKQDPVSHGAIMDGVLSMIERSGGMAAIVQQLREKGLSEQVDSWIGTGANEAVSGDQIQDALGSEQVEAISRQAGIEPGHASAGLAQLLPQLIDQLTPGGSVPSDDMLAQGIALLKGRLFG
jgi:uncharacterized protein YidB (DUF937 family)